MSEKSFSRLSLYGAECPVSGQPLNWSGTTQLRERLLNEICALDRQCDLLEQIDGKIDFSLQQTCREMIHSRQVLYRQLGR
ncbi:MAG: hypothetical protein V7746_23110 [Halioglobus sp.]